MKKFLFLAILAACQSTSPVSLTNGNEKSLEELQKTPAKNYPIKGWHPDYDAAILLALRGHPISAPCNNPLLLIKAMANAESGFRRQLEYKESGHLQGVVSTGLLQISLNSSKSYDCGMKAQEDLKHPIKNLVCGVKIIHWWAKKLPNANIYQVGGKYWSTLRDERYWPGRKSYTGVEKVKKYAKENGCVFPQ